MTRTVVYTKANVFGVRMSELLYCKIRIVGTSKRIYTAKTYNERPSCTGYNVNLELVDGMTVAEYQAMIKRRFDEKDPMFSLTKHLRSDINVGYVRLEG